jgi:hypothetical protein
MERVLLFLGGILRIFTEHPAWSFDRMTAARHCAIDHDPSQGVRHIARWDRVAGG